MFQAGDTVNSVKIANRKRRLATKMENSERAASVTEWDEDYSGGESKGNGGDAPQVTPAVHRRHWLGADGRTAARPSKGSPQGEEMGSSETRGGRNGMEKRRTSMGQNTSMEWYPAG